MPLEALNSDTGETRLNQVLAEYFEAVETGLVIDETKLVIDHPDLSDDLADFLNALHEVDRFAAQLRRVVAPFEPVVLPKAFDDYDFVAEIGRGGMGVVYRAHQRSLNRYVAVKMIRGNQPTTAEDIRRLCAEAEAAAHLDHPGIVPIYEIGQHDGLPFFSMKLFQGGSLAERIGAFPFDPQQAAELVGLIARAVHHAHQRGILHRDLKPSNILLDAEGRPHVADFGLAKWLNADQTQTQTGMLMGTPAYMAPELVVASQASARKSMATTACDVYGLGAILYSLLTGRPPFQERLPIDTLLAIREHEPESPDRLNPRVDRDLATICLKCLEKDPGRRYGSAAELADDLLRWQAHEPILARPIGNTERLRRWCRRNPVLAVTTAAAALIVFFGISSLFVGYALVSRANTIAVRHQLDAERKAAQLRERLYVGQMSLGFRHWERGELNELQTVLNEFQDDAHLKGYEWRWLDSGARSRPREMIRYTGHQAVVFCATFFPDGTRVASCGEDRTVQIWDAATGQTQANVHPNPATASLPIKGQTEDENFVRIAPNGRQMVSVCEDGSVRLWDLSLRTWQALLPSHQGETLCADFSPDGRWLVTGGTDQVVRVWDLDNSSHTDVTLHSDAVTGVAFSPDGQRVASADDSGTVHVWNRDNLTAQFSLKGAGTCVAFSPDGSRLATGNRAGWARLWNAITCESLDVIGPVAGHLRSLDFSPDSRQLACACDDGSVRVWSIPDRQALHYFTAHSGRIWSVRFSPDGRTLLTASADSTCRIWQLPAPSQPFYWPGAPQAAVVSVKFAPSGTQVLVTTEAHELLEGDIAKRAPMVTLPVKASFWGDTIVFAPDGDVFAFVAMDGSVRRWHRNEHHELDLVLPGRDSGNGLKWNPEAVRIAYTADGRLWALDPDGTLHVCDGQQWREYSTSCRNSGVLLPIPRQNVLAIHDHDRSLVRMWNFEHNEFERDVAFPNVNDPTCCSPDGKTLAIAAGRNIHLLNIALGSSRKLVGHRLGVRCLNFLQDGKTLASVGGDGTVRLWHVATGQELFILENRGGANFVNSVAVSSNDRFLVVGGRAYDFPSTLTVYDIGPPESSPSGN